MDLNQHVDIYCERLDANFWAEPLNAISNIAFIFAALCACKYLRQSGKKALDISILIALATVVGLGSFAFHTDATNLTMLFDIFPIIIFIFFATGVIFHRVLGFNKPMAVVYVVFFALINFLTLKIFGREVLNGSMTYVPTLLLLIGVGLWTRGKKPYSNDILTAVLAFLLSISFRSMDMAVCDMIPTGVHFMWHTLNGIVMYYVMKALIRSIK